MFALFLLARFQNYLFATLAGLTLQKTEATVHPRIYRRIRSLSLNFAERREKLILLMKYNSSAKSTVRFTNTGLSRKGEIGLRKFV